MTTQFIITILAISVYTASVIWRDEWTYFCWHANVVPAFFQGPFQWPAHYLPLWMGILHFSLGRYHSALASFEDVRSKTSVLLKERKPGIVDRFKVEVWKCKCLVELKDADNAHMACFSTTLFTILPPIPSAVQLDIDIARARAEIMHAVFSDSVLIMEQANTIIQKILQAHPDNTEAKKLLQDADVDVFKSQLQEKREREKRAREEQFQQSFKEKRESLEREYERFKRWMDETLENLFGDRKGKSEQRAYSPPPHPPKTPWQLLDISPGASAQDIRRAYKRKALELHPDKTCSAGRCNTQAEKDLANKRFHELVKAYETIIKNTWR